MNVYSVTLSNWRCKGAGVRTVELFSCVLLDTPEEAEAAARDEWDQAKANWAANVELIVENVTMAVDESKITPLTEEQQAHVRSEALETSYANALQNTSYLRAIMRQWIDSKTPIEQAEICSSDREMWPNMFDFNPESGEEWPEDD